MNYKAIVEGLLFISGEDGLSLDEICSITELNKDEASSILKNIFKDYENPNRGLHIEYLGGAFKLTTKPEHKEFYKKLAKSEENSPLTQSALETLAIIAYNGPITRIEIDEIRGVNSAYVLRKLLLTNLVSEVGISNSPGKPKIYNITPKFLDHFGLGSIEELPSIENKNTNQNQEDEKDLFQSKYNEQKTEYI